MGLAGLTSFISGDGLAAGDLVLKMRPSVVVTHYKCCSSCLAL